MKENFFKLLKGRNLLDDDNMSEKNSDDYALLLQLFIGRGEFFIVNGMQLTNKLLMIG